MLPSPLKKLSELLATLPSIGPRQALRLTFYMMSLGKASMNDFAQAFQGLTQLSLCTDCFYIHQNTNGKCAMCNDVTRNKTLIAIVEKETDVLSLEKTKKFTGTYLIIGALKKNCILEQIQKMKLNALIGRIKKLPGGIAEEILIATNPTTYGDFSAMIIQKEVQGHAKKITRLGRGIPTGGEIEFADEATLEQALKHRD